MGKDYKIGLMCGLVAAVVVVVWVATRPSLNTPTWTYKPQTASAQQAAVSSKPVSAGQTNASPPQSTATPAPQRQETPRVSEPAPVVSKRVEAPAIAPVRTHIVQRGETLSSIAQQYYGNPNAWQRIVKANSTVIKNPNVVPPGTKLTIP